MVDLEWPFRFSQRHGKRARLLSANEWRPLGEQPNCSGGTATTGAFKGRMHCLGRCIEPVSTNRRSNDEAQADATDDGLATVNYCTARLGSTASGLEQLYEFNVADSKCAIHQLYFYL